MVSVAARTCLVEVVDYVYLSAAGAAIASALCIIHHTVTEIHIFGLCGVCPVVLTVIVIVSVSFPTVACAVKTRAAVADVCYHVMMETGQFATPNATVTVGSLVVPRIGEAFGYGTPLHCEVVVVVERGHLVNAP